MPLASKHFHIIIGVDIHFTTLPPFNPFQPFIGFVFDPFDYIPKIGATVKINGMPRGVSDSSGMMPTIIHIPIATGPFVAGGFIQAESMNFFGGINTYADGARMSTSPYMLMTCSDIGIPLSLSPGKKFKPIPKLFTPMATSIPLPMGAPVMVNDPQVPDLGTVLRNMVMGYTMGSLLKGVGHLINKIPRGPIDKFFKQTLGLGDAWQKVRCMFGRDPVDLVSGRVMYDGTDFTMPGPLPLSWERTYYSGSKMEGLLGKGTQMSYDRKLHLVAERGERAILITLGDGRTAAFAAIETGTSFYNRSEKLRLHNHGDYYEVEDIARQELWRFNIRTRSSAFEQTWLLSSIENRLGHDICFAYDDKGVMTAITDSAGRNLYLKTNRHGYIEQVYHTENGKDEILVEYGYNADGWLNEITDALGQSTSIDYDASGQMIKKTDRNGQSFYWQYDAKGRCIFTNGDGGILKGTIAYHEDYNIETDSLGRSRKIHYNEQKLVTGVTDAEGNFSEKHYTEFGELLRTINAEGDITGYDYDELGLVTSIHYPNNTTETFFYDDLGRCTMHRLPQGGTALWTYNEQHQLISSINPRGTLTVYTYYPNNLLHKITQEGCKAPLIFAYDAHANLTTATTPDGHITRWHYDALGRCTQRTNAQEGTQTYRFDPLGRVVQTSLPDDNVINLAYDAYDDVVRATDRQHDVKFGYTPLGSLTRREENGVTIKFAYNTEEELQAVINEKGESYRFGRDRNGAVITETGFDDIVRKYQRSAAGRVVRTERPGGRWTEYQHNGMGQVVRAAYSDGSWETYTYDQNGLLSEAANANSTVSFKRNEQGQVISETQEGGHTVTSTYDKWSNRTAIGSTLGANIDIGMDALTGRVQSMRASQNDHASWEAKMTYNGLGLEVERALNGGVRSTWSYDNIGRPVEQRVSDGRGHISRSRNYSWSINDKLQSIHNLINGTAVHYGYDAFDNLITAVETPAFRAEHYFRDEVGNIFNREGRTDRKYGAGGRLTEMSGTKYYYDEEGFLKYKDELNKGRWAFEWQGNGMMKSVKRPDGKLVSFEYDALGRRTAKLFEGQITRFVWDGNTPLHEWKYNIDERPKLVADEWGFLSYDKEETVSDLITWIFDEGTFKPAGKITAEDTYSIINDHLGTPKEAYDHFGNKVWECELTAYGKVKACSDAGFIPFRFQGQYEDVETELYYNRFRYYSPDEGMYVTAQDPIRLNGDCLGLYSFVRDSNIIVDILGLNPIIVIGEIQSRVNKAAIQLKKQGLEVRTITDDWSREFINYDPYIKELHEAQSVEYNRRWIRARMMEGYDIYDIGPKGRNSVFYAAEHEEIFKAKYKQHYGYNTETGQKIRLILKCK